MEIRNIMALLLVPPPVNIVNMRIDNPPLWNIDYPATIGMKNLLIQQKINQDIYALLIKLVRILQYPQTITYISTAYEIKTNEENVLSLSLDGLGDFHGAHPVNSRKSITFDCKTGKVYELHDLFKAGSGYLEKLSYMVADQIKERNISLTSEFKGIRPDQDFYIADLCLVIYFQQYEIAPRPEGFPSFPIPLYSIQDMIPEYGILERLLG